MQLSDLKLLKIMKIIHQSWSPKRMHQRKHQNHILQLIQNNVWSYNHNQKFMFIWHGLTKLTD